MKSSALIDTYSQLPITIADGVGARVRDDLGRVYWDFYGGHAVALLGHCHAAVTRALVTQSARLTFYSNAAPLVIRTRAAERLINFIGPDFASVFFCNSGAEANENALKLAIQQTGRGTIAALAGAFHGRTLLALAATDGRKLRAPFEAILPPSIRLRPNALDDIAQIDESVAAVIVEAIQSMAGVIELTPGYLAALRARCNEVGALLIFDEVQTGMGRLGRPLAAGRFGVMPDIVTLAKGLANGVPAGALLVSEKIACRVALGDLGSTFGGGPLACAALLAVIDTIEREQLCKHAAQLGEAMRGDLSVGPVTEVIGRGCLVGLRLNRPAHEVQRELIDCGFLTATSGDPHVLRLLPPINLPFEAIGALALALKSLGEKPHATLVEHTRL